MTPTQRPRLPTRSISTTSSAPPTDASKPDDAAVDDVYREVSSTGSLHAAAKKLEQYARWADDPEEAGYLGVGGAYEGVDEDAVMSDEDEDGEGEGQEREHLQEIIEGLWVGDLVAAMDEECLKERGITNILSLLRPSLKFSPDFAVYPLEIDDSADTDLLTHLPSCVAWIQSVLDLRRRSLDLAASGHSEPAEPGEAQRAPEIAKIAQQPKVGGVLVHCQAGMSRSASVTAAYLMRALELDPMEAVEMIREKRPVVEPSATFWHQLGLFYNADGRVSLRDRSTRQYYMERTTTQFINGDGTAPSMEKMARYPATPSPSNPPTPMGYPRRKIRCKMCRRQLAVREHMMDHILDQAPPPSRPRTPSNIALPSPRLSFSSGAGMGFTAGKPEGDSPGGVRGRERRASVVSDVINPLTGLPGATRSRRASGASNSASSPAPAQTLYDRDAGKDSASTGGSGASANANKPLTPGVPLPRTTTPGVMTPKSDPVTPAGTVPGPAPRAFQSADQLAARLPPHLLALRTAGSGGGGLSSLPSAISSSPVSSPEREMTGPALGGAGACSGSSASAGAGSGAQSAARKMSLLAMTPTAGGDSEGSASEGVKRRGSSGEGAMHGGPPILVNIKCSGYFVEPLTWMEPVLSKGQVAGKLVCPNEKCGVKIGNFDWAGVQCGCKEWVTPGFCIHRSKVDEVW
ncbi:hypothetical protein IAT38_005200 [Cryptococcus sp. DSM 104549]